MPKEEMVLPEPGERIIAKVHRYLDVNGRIVDEWTLEGVVEWADGNGAWVKGLQKSRWLPLEEFRHHHEKEG